MSRENLKQKLLDLVNEAIKGNLSYIQNSMLSDNFKSEYEDDILYGERVIREFAYLTMLRDFLKEDKFDPFTQYSAKYEPGAVPAYPEGKTIWEIDDTDIGIIEEDPKRLIQDVLHFLEEHRLAYIWESLQPQVIRSDYISIIERCIYEKKKGDK